MLFQVNDKIDTMSTPSTASVMPTALGDSRGRQSSSQAVRAANTSAKTTAVHGISRNGASHAVRKIPTPAGRKQGEALTTTRLPQQ